MFIAWKQLGSHLV